MPMPSFSKSPPELVARFGEQFPAKKPKQKKG